MRDHLILRTSIKSPLKKTVLFRGTGIAALGGVAILAGGFISEGILTVWGLPLYLVGVLLIVIGLKPHQKLKQMENIPNEILVDQNLMMTFKHKKLEIFSISLKAFSKFQYIDRGEDYGLAFWFTEPRTQYFFIHQTHLNLEDLQAQAREKYGSDLFLPYFSQRTCEALTEFIELENSQTDDQESF